MTTQSRKDRAEHPVSHLCQSERPGGRHGITHAILIWRDRDMTGVLFVEQAAVVARSDRLKQQSSSGAMMLFQDLE